MANKGNATAIIGATFGGMVLRPRLSRRCAAVCRKRQRTRRSATRLMLAWDLSTGTTGIVLAVVDKIALAARHTALFNLSDDGTGRAASDPVSTLLVAVDRRPSHAAVPARRVVQCGTTTPTCRFTTPANWAFATSRF